jgi:hypothetical protein
MVVSPDCAQHDIASLWTRFSGEPAMQQATFDSSSDSTSGRKGRRSAYIVGGSLLALAIITAAIIDLPGGRTFVSGGPVETSAGTFSAVATDQAVATTGNAAAPHFERSDEPAVEDTVNAHGG